MSNAEAGLRYTRLHAIEIGSFVMRDCYALACGTSLYEASDPNGIRTRVTAVKGRCPGPLDDRVGSAGNIGTGVVDAR